MAQNIWHGTEKEGQELIAAIEHNCTCKRNNRGGKAGLCSVHELFVHNQSFIDGLLFFRRMREALLEEEWIDDPVPDHL
jgi:hypothetical protein